MGKQKKRQVSTKKKKDLGQTLKLKCSARLRKNCVKKYFKYGTFYAAGKDLGIDSNIVKYWVMKYVDDSFHCQGHGGIFFSSFHIISLAFWLFLGFRNGTFKPHEMPILQREIVSHLSKHPTSRMHELAHYLQLLFGRSIGIPFVHKSFFCLSFISQATILWDEHSKPWDGVGVSLQDFKFTNTGFQTCSIIANFCSKYIRYRSTVLNLLMKHI